MNKQELIEKYKNKYPVISMDVKEFRYFIELWEDMKQLDEPQKQVVPQFVANWIEYFKNCKGTLYGSTNPFSYYGRAILEDFEGDYDEVLRWIRDNSDTYARAWLDGYRIEKEKRYRVNVKNIRTRQGTLNRSKKSGVFIFSNPEENNLYGTKFTRKELEDGGFSGVFDNPLFEVEEVE